MPSFKNLEKWTPPSGLADSFASGDGAGEAIAATERSIVDYLTKQGVPPELAAEAARAFTKLFLESLAKGVSPIEAVGIVKNDIQVVVDDEKPASEDPTEALQEALAKGENLESALARAAGASQDAHSPKTRAYMKTLESALKSGVPLADAMATAQKAMADTPDIQDLTAPKDAMLTSLAEGGDAKAAVDALTAGRTPEEASAFSNSLESSLAKGASLDQAISEASQAADRALAQFQETSTAQTPASRLAQALASGEGVEQAVATIGTGAAGAKALMAAFSKGMNATNAMAEAQAVSVNAANAEQTASVAISQADRMAMALATGDTSVGGRAFQAFAAALAAGVSSTTAAARVDAQLAAIQEQSLASSVPMSPAHQLTAALASGNGVDAAVAGQGKNFVNSLATALSRGGDVGESFAHASESELASVTQLAQAEVAVSPENQFYANLAAGIPTAIPTISTSPVSEPAAGPGPLGGIAQVATPTQAQATPSLATAVTETVSTTTLSWAQLTSVNPPWTQPPADMSNQTRPVEASHPILQETQSVSTPQAPQSQPPALPTQVAPQQQHSEQQVTQPVSSGGGGGGGGSATHAPSQIIAARAAGAPTPTLSSVTAGHNLVNGLGVASGFGAGSSFGETVLTASDDGYQQIDVSSAISSFNFASTTYSGATQFFVSRNGYVTFGTGNGSYSPTGISTTTIPSVVPFFLDINTTYSSVNYDVNGNSTGTNRIFVDTDSTNNIVTVTFDDVARHTDSATAGGTNAFQVRLHDQGSGDFDIEFRYEYIAWAQHGSAWTTVGWTAGDRVNYSEATGSGTNAMTNLASSTNIGQAGVFFWEVRSGKANEVLSVTENAANDTAVATLSAKDSDTGDTHTFSLLNDAGGRFKIVGSELRVADGTLLDYETTTSHSVQIRATDQTGLTRDQTFTVNVADCVGDPLVLDLDGDGVHLTSFTDGKWFDMNADGVLDRTGWFSGDDAVLVWDQNGDGTASNIAELVSEWSTPGTASSLDALASMDSNGDGRVDSVDPGFANLTLWDGVDGHALVSLQDAGIAALLLDRLSEVPRTENQNTVTASASFEWANGEQGQMAEVSFEYAPSAFPHDDAGPSYSEPPSTQAETADAGTHVIA